MVPWDNRLAWVKHGGPEAIEISLGDTREICRLGDGSALHVVELEECRDHHLVVKQQQKLLASWHGDVQLVNCIGSHQNESTIEFSDALGYKGNVDRASGEFVLRESEELSQHVFQTNPVSPAMSACSSS
jgi:hypothetical protein